MENNNFQLSDFLEERKRQNEKYLSNRIDEIRKYLDSNGVNISISDYKKESNYIKIKNAWREGFPGGGMSIEEFIERIMFTEYTFDSIYDMGNPGEIKDSECTERGVAAEIIRILSLDEEGIIEANVCSEFNRKGGFIERIKKYLGVDLNELDKNDNREKRERSKILYFFYMLEREHSEILYFSDMPERERQRRTRVLMLLNKPSMENIYNKPLGWETKNGTILHTVKEALGKELSLEEKGRIYSAIATISMEWDKILDNARLLLDFFYDYGFDYNSMELFPSPMPVFTSNKDAQEDVRQYPVARLYLIISQREYLGNLLDIAFVNKIQNSNNYDVPPELVEEMKSLIHKSVDLNNAEKYIKDNALRLSRYVYIGKKATKDEVRRIRTFAHKIQKFLNFCCRANCVMPIQWISNELQIVSFLQALILDDSSEEFDYTYHGYQCKSTHMMRVQAALKNDERVPDALQIYWVRKVVDRWYANVGKYDVRLKLRQIERTCDEIRKQILSQSTLYEMLDAHKFYLEQIDRSFLEVDAQLQSVKCILDYLQKLGFKYKDYGCKIRYAFLDSEDCDFMCNLILMTIQNTIRNHAPMCRIECEAESTAVKDAEFFLDLVFDYSENICTLARFEAVFK